MKINVYWVPWNKGEFFYWNNTRFNNGDVYTGYRLGPIIVRIRKKL